MNTNINKIPAGQTKYFCGQRATIKGLTGKDEILNGLTGTITIPFEKFGALKNEVGLYLDTPFSLYGNEINIHTKNIKIIPSTDTLVKFFETEGFQTDKCDDGSLELQTWTEGGVNMLIYLQTPSPDEFREYVDGFNIDEEIIIHRQDERYLKDFTLNRSLADFKAYKSFLKKVARKVASLEK